MSKVHYYGKRNNFVGKTLYEILANLRDFGLNRMLIKQEEILQNPGKTCYYIVKKVEPVMDADLKEGAIYAERVFRGAKVPDLVYVEEESWHNDWQLIPRHEESKYLLDPAKMVEHGHPETVTILPRWMEVPPLMDIFLRRHINNRKGIQLAPALLDKKRINIRMHYDLKWMNRPHSRFRVAEEGEKHHINFNLPLKELLPDHLKPKSMRKSASG